MMPIRKFENLHILLWLLKDTSWLLGWKSLGMFMIFPTLSFACFITYQLRNEESDFFHNLATIFWIIANSFWMITEFAGVEEQYKIYAIIPFLIGLSLILFYYTKFFIKKLSSN